jgi:hypothetical protein
LLAKSALSIPAIRWRWFVPGTELDPSKILQVGTGFWASKTLLSAVELGVFTVLDNEPSMTGPQLGDRLQLHRRAIYDFLDALVALGFLDRAGWSRWPIQQHTRNRGLSEPAQPAIRRGTTGNVQCAAVRILE